MRNSWRSYPLCLAAWLLTAMILVPLIVNAESRLDNFAPNIDGPINTIAIQKDGKIMIGGEFGSVDGIDRNCIARLNSDGTVDLNFETEVSILQLAKVESIAIQDDGKMLIGGEFYFTYDPWHYRSGIIRLNSNGTRDESFSQWSVNKSPRSIVLQPDGKILIGGHTTIEEGPDYIARLNMDGQFDESFNPVVNANVESIALLEDGRILVGGAFTTANGQPRSHVARFMADGTLDASFIDPNVNVDSTIHALTVQDDNKILICGNFVSVGGQAVYRLARLNADGSPDMIFKSRLNTTVDNEVMSIVVQRDGEILIAGYFTSVGGQIRNYIARLNLDGTVNEAFNPTADDPVYTIAMQTDGKIIIGGAFATVDSQSRSFIARLNADPPLPPQKCSTGKNITCLEKYAPVLYISKAWSFSDLLDYKPKVIGSIVNEADLNSSNPLDAHFVCTNRVCTRPCIPGGCINYIFGKKCWKKKCLSETCVCYWGYFSPTYVHYPKVTLNDLMSHNADKYNLDMVDAEPSTPLHFWKVPPSTRFEKYQTVVYGREEKAPDDKNMRVLQYWFYYPYNDWHNKHEGDWEQITLILDETTREPVANNYAIAYSEHKGGSHRYWNASDLEKIDGTHPVVYGGKGSHASYFTRGAHDVSDCFTDHADPVQALVPNLLANYALEFPKSQYTILPIKSSTNWSNWNGHWGATKDPLLPDVGDEGPTGPGVKGAWKNPVKFVNNPGDFYYDACVFSPVNLHIYDSKGNHVGPTATGEMEYNIPGVYAYDSVGHGYLIDNPGDLTYKLEATDTGSFDFSVARYQEDTATKVTAQYRNVFVNEKTMATVAVSASNPTLEMLIDLNGDGSIITIKAPDEVNVEQKTVGTLDETAVFNIPPAEPDDGNMTHTILTNADTHGTISPSGEIMVNREDNISFTITPNEGYYIGDVLVDGLSQGPTTSFDFMNVTASHSIEATFAADIHHTILASAGYKGIITPSGEVPVPSGQNQNFSIAANAGYYIEDVFVDGISQGPTKTYDFTNVTSNHTIEVSFAPHTYFITASAGTGGLIDPPGVTEFTPDYDDDSLSIIYGIVPNEGFHIADVLVDGVSVGAVDVYDFTNITANRTIFATFAPNEDTTPDPFAFVSRTTVLPNTLVTSNTITVAGINAPAPISISGGQYSINGGAFTSGEGVINDGDSVSVQLTSSQSYATTKTAALIIGGVSGPFDVTTQLLNFTGLYNPVDNLPVVNSAKAGQSIPVKWRLTDENDIPIFDLASFKHVASYLISCESLSGDLSAPIEEYAAGSSGLQYLGDGVWQYNWKTPKSYAGQCRRMVLTLDDGSTHEADFKFAR